MHLSRHPIVGLGLALGLALHGVAWGGANNGNNASVPVAFDPISRRYAVYYWEFSAEYGRFVQIFDEDGDHVSGPHDLGTQDSQPFGALVANTTQGGFLLTWVDYSADTTRARRVGADGSLGAIFDVPDLPQASALMGRAVYDPVRDRYIAVFATSDDVLHGRFIAGDGSAAVGASFPLGESPEAPMLEIDPMNDELLVIAADSSYRTELRRFSAADGVSTGPVVPIGTDFTGLGAAFDPITGNLLAVSARPMPAGVLVSRTGSVSAPRPLFGIDTAGDVSVDVDPYLGRFAVSVSDYVAEDALGVLVDVVQGAPQNEGFPVGPSAVSPSAPGVAANLGRHNFGSGLYDVDGGGHAVHFSLFPGVCADRWAAETSELGSTATVAVRLCAVPSAALTVELGSNTPSEGIASPSELSFTTANWSQPQIVTITGVDDGAPDGDRDYDVTFQVAAAAAAREYAGTTAHVRCVNRSRAGAACGDGAIGTGEACDDGNVSPGDGCSASCQLEGGFSCTGQPSMCVPIPVPDAGTVADATSPDTGSGLDAATSSDAGLRRDAGIGPRDAGAPVEEESGCSCRAERSGPGHAGGLVLLMLFGLVLSRSRRR